MESLDALVTFPRGVEMPRSSSRVRATARRGSGERGERAQAWHSPIGHHFRSCSVRHAEVGSALLPVRRRPTPTPTGKSLGLSPALSKELKSLFHSPCPVAGHLFLGFAAQMSVRLDANNPEPYRELLDKYDTWMLDCDGVLWHGDRLIDGAVQVLEILRSHRKRILFVTNNATKSRRNYKKKFDGLGIEAHVDEVFGSAYAAAVYLSSVLNFPKDKRVYVIGMSGLEDELRSEGISFIGGTDPADNTLSAPGEIPPDPSVGAVLIGLDTSINYTKLSRAFRYLHSNPECFFLATNEDSTYPSEKGLLPGAGAVLAPLVTALGPNRPVTAIGKPSSLMLDAIKAKHNFDPRRTIMVGDRLNTDIQFGKSGGLATLLVLTGITSENDLTGPNPSPIVPDYVTTSIGDLRIAIGDQTKK